MNKIINLQDWIYEKIIKSNKQPNNCKLKEKVKNDYESCVLCNEQLTILKSVPIDKRIGYIEGVGQLCTSCLVKLYASK